MQPQSHTPIVPRPPRRGRWSAAAVACAALGCLMALAGCGGTQHHSATRTASGSASATRTTSASTTSQAPPRAIRQVSYTVPESSGDEQMRVAVYDLRRQGPYLVLDLGVSCAASGGGCSDPWSMAPLNQATSSQALTSTQVDAWTASGADLIDPGTLQEYLPVRDAKQRPFASQLPSTSDNRTHLAWVRYPAPPAPVTALDVVLPEGGPQIPNVPISSGPAPVAAGGLVPASPAPFAQPPDSTQTTGLKLPVRNLVALVGNHTGSDAESPGQSTITLSSDVLFRFAKSSLTAKARSVLHQVAAQIRTRATGPVQVTGYTDSIGSDAVNIPLSNARARSVVQALKPSTPGVTYRAAGKGSADPVAPNKTADGSDNPAGRALNRRVTIAFAAKRRAAPQPPPPTGGPKSGAAASSSAVNFTVGPLTPPDAYRVTATALFREANTLVLRLALSCRRASQSGSCGTLGDLIGTSTVPPAAPQGDNFAFGAFWSVSGFYLTDPATGTDYTVLHTPGRVPITAATNNDLPVHQTRPYWLYFPAPSRPVSSMTLTTPGNHKSITVPVAGSPPAP